MERVAISPGSSSRGRVDGTDFRQTPELQIQAEDELQPHVVIPKRRSSTGNIPAVTHKLLTKTKSVVADGVKNMELEESDLEYSEESSSETETEKSHSSQSSARDGLNIDKVH